MSAAVADLAVPAALASLAVPAAVAGVQVCDGRRGEAVGEQQARRQGHHQLAGVQVCVETAGLVRLVRYRSCASYCDQGLR